MKRIFPKEEVCIGCRLCEVHCLVEHSASKDVIKAYTRETPRPLPRLRVQMKGTTSFPVPCRHCSEPLCVYSCLTGALSQDPATGVVTVDKKKCKRCWTCILACPYGAIWRDTESIVKCDFCPGRDVPACVANCPNEALVLAEA